MFSCCNSDEESGKGKRGGSLGGLRRTYWSFSNARGGGYSRPIERGAAKLAHGNRGMKPVHPTPKEVCQKVVELAQRIFAGCHQLTEIMIRNLAI